MLFNEALGINPAQVAYRNRMQREGKPMRGYGIPPSVAKRVHAQYGDYGLLMKDNTPVDWQAGYGIPPAVARRVKANFGINAAQVAWAKSHGKRMNGFGLLMRDNTPVDWQAGYGYYDASGNWVDEPGGFDPASGIPYAASTPDATAPASPSTSTDVLGTIGSIFNTVAGVVPSVIGALTPRPAPTSTYHPTPTAMGIGTGTLMLGALGIGAFLLLRKPRGGGGAVAGYGRHKRRRKAKR